MDDYIDKVIELMDFTQNKPLNEIVFNGLRTSIIKGIIPVGERINEIVYAEKMNISRTPVREALRRIQEERLVEYIPHYGVVVKRITLADAEEIFKIRKALDVLAALNAMELMTEKDFDDLESLLKKTDKANNLDNASEVIKLSSDFNDFIYDASKMPRLEMIVRRLREYLIRFRDISLTGKERRDQALKEHWMIYNNMRNKNNEQVKIIIEEHLVYSEKFIINEMINEEKHEKEIKSERRK